MDKGKTREGFSLIELIIAIAIMAIIMTSVILIISYSANNMRRTTNTVNLQNQAKDAVTHITTQIQEGTDAEWLESQNTLVVIDEHEELSGDVNWAKVGFYQFVSSDKTIYFNQKYLLIYDTDESECSTSITDLNLTDESEYAKIQSSVYKNKRVIDYDAVYTALSSKMSVDADFKLVDDVKRFSYESDPSKGEAVEIVTTPEPETPEGEPSEPTPTPTASPNPDDVSGKTIPIYITMENETGEAEFYSVKKIYPRNQ